MIFYFDPHFIDQGRAVAIDDGACHADIVLLENPCEQPFADVDVVDLDGACDGVRCLSIDPCRTLRSLLGRGAVGV